MECRVFSRLCGRPNLILGAHASNDAVRVWVGQHACADLKDVKRVFSHCSGRTSGRDAFQCYAEFVESSGIVVGAGLSRNGHQAVEKRFADMTAARTFISLTMRGGRDGNLIRAGVHLPASQIRIEGTRGSAGVGRL